MPVTPKVSMLEVSTEARSVALQKSISLVPSKNAIGEQHFPDIRFNLDLDVLWVLNIEGFFGFCDLERMVGKVSASHYQSDGTCHRLQEDNQGILLSGFLVCDKI